MAKLAMYHVARWTPVLMLAAAVVGTMLQTPSCAPVP